VGGFDQMLCKVVLRIFCSFVDFVWSLLMKDCCWCLEFDKLKLGLCLCCDHCCVVV
jgi:hypothetical protein